MRLMIQVHDLYVASPNAAQPGFFGTQGAFYKVEMTVDERRKRVVEFQNQLVTLEGLMDGQGPYTLGGRPCLADCVIFPTMHMLLHCCAGVMEWDEAAFFGPNTKLQKWYNVLLETPGFKEVADAQTEWQQGAFTAERLHKIRDQLSEP